MNLRDLFKVGDRVRLTVDLPDNSGRPLKAGDLGTVILGVAMQPLGVKFDRYINTPIKHWLVGSEPNYVNVLTLVERLP